MFLEIYTSVLYPVWMVLSGIILSVFIFCYFAFPPILNHLLFAFIFFLCYFICPLASSNTHGLQSASSLYLLSLYHFHCITVFSLYLLPNDVYSFEVFNSK